MRLLVYILFGMFVGVGGYTFWYGQGFTYMLDDPAACMNCHIMREHHDSWLKASHHAVATCNDCHTPSALIPKLLSKAENGFWHSKGFTMQDFHEPIRIRPHNAAVLNANCIRCHGELTALVTAAHGPQPEAPDCIRCHTTVGHGPNR